MRRGLGPAVRSGSRKAQRIAFAYELRCSQRSSRAEQLPFGPLTPPEQATPMRLKGATRHHSELFGVLRHPNCRSSVAVSSIEWPSMPRRAGLANEFVVLRCPETER